MSCIAHFEDANYKTYKWSKFRIFAQKLQKQHFFIKINFWTIHIQTLNVKHGFPFGETMESIAPSFVGTDLSRDSRNPSLRYEYKTGMVAVKEYTPFAVLTTRIATETSEFPLTCKFVYLSSLKTISRTTKLHSMTLPQRKRQGWKEHFRSVS